MVRFWLGIHHDARWLGYLPQVNQLSLAAVKLAIHEIPPGSSGLFLVPSHIKALIFKTILFSRGYPSNIARDRLIIPIYWGVWQGFGQYYP
jgi:hypothetical protein